MIYGYGLWLMAYGLWLMAYGLWLMAYGLWLMAYGLWLKFTMQLNDKQNFCLNMICKNR